MMMEKEMENWDISDNYDTVCREGTTPDLLRSASRRRCCSIHKTTRWFVSPTISIKQINNNGMLICNVGCFDPSATRGHWTHKMKASASWTATLEEPVVRTNITVPCQLLAYDLLTRYYDHRRRLGDQTQAQDSLGAGSERRMYALLAPSM